MKKIITKVEQERKKRRNHIIIGIFLIFIMGFSVIDYSLTKDSTDSSNLKKIDYGGITFLKQSEYWLFSYNGHQFSTIYNPKETEDIPINIKSNLETYSNKPIYYVGSYPEYFSEISRNLNSFILREQMACINGENCSEDLPIKNCSEDNLIILKEPLENDTERVYQDEGCVFIIASYSNQTKYLDSFLFKVLGI
jgi:hypothetical protein